jgi:hypothetical protein
MAAHKKSVDEIWRELNARPPPRSSTTGIPGFGIPGVQTRTRILPNHPQQAVQDVPVLSHNQQQQQPTAAGLQVAGDLAAASGVSSEHLQQYMTSIQRTINCLTDSDRAVRKAGVLTLQAKLLKGDAATPKASPSMLQVINLAVAGCPDVGSIAIVSSSVDAVCFGGIPVGTSYAPA